ncbi:MAG TPA: DUF4402 domain-containing protein [Bacteroidales bacterium]|nr:DUF4402 domain-containing protein [Bacteroidales bacterium]
MKTLTRLFTIILVSFCTMQFANAQATANGNASVVIIAPIAIGETTPMNFGTIVPGTVNGTVTLTTAGARNLSNVTAVGAGFAAAVFTVTGQSGYTFVVDIPAAGTAYNISDGTNTLAVNGWSSNPADGATGTLTGGTATITVGAVLAVPTGTTAGTYNSVKALGQTYPVTVNYN